MLQKVQDMGENFITQEFQTIKKLQSILFETIIMFYDPYLEGYLEKIERQVDQLLSEHLLSQEVYQIVLVFARIKKINEDKQIRLK